MKMKGHELEELDFAREMTLTLEISVALATEQRIRSSDSKDAFISGVIDDAVKVIRRDPTVAASLEAADALHLTDELRDLAAQARSLTTNGKHAEALEALGTIVIEHPKWPEAHELKGRALDGMGQQNDAASAYLSSLVLDVENVGTREQLNKILSGLLPFSGTQQEMEVSFTVTRMVDISRQALKDLVPRIPAPDPNIPETNPEEDIPVYVLSAAFPNVTQPLHMYEQRYQLMVRRCMESTKEFGMCETSASGPFATYGTTVIIKSADFSPGGPVQLDTEGGRRFKVLSHSMRDGYHFAHVKFFSDVKEDGEQLEDLKRIYNSIFKEVRDWFDTLPPDVRERFKENHGDMPDIEEEPQAKDDGAAWVWWAFGAMRDQFEPQDILKSISLRQRLLKVQELLQEQKRLSEMCPQQ